MTLHLNTILVLILGLACLLMTLTFCVRRARPHGILHIDQYIDKAYYRMLYLIPMDDVPKHHYVILKIESQTWNTYSDDREEEF